MFTLTKALLLNAYRDTLKIGCRPTEILLCTKESGSLVQWDIKNSKHLMSQYTAIENEFGQPGDYLVFGNNHRLLGDIVFYVPD